MTHKYSRMDALRMDNLITKLTPARKCIQNKWFGLPQVKWSVNKNECSNRIYFGTKADLFDWMKKSLQIHIICFLCRIIQMAVSCSILRLLTPLKISVFLRHLFCCLIYSKMFNSFTVFFTSSSQIAWNKNLKLTNRMFEINENNRCIV